MLFFSFLKLQNSISLTPHPLWHLLTHCSSPRNSSLTGSLSSLPSPFSPCTLGLTAPTPNRECFSLGHQQPPSCYMLAFGLAAMSHSTSSALIPGHSPDSSYPTQGAHRASVAPAQLASKGRVPLGRDCEHLSHLRSLYRSLTLSHNSQHCTRSELEYTSPCCCSF